MTPQRADAGERREEELTALLEHVRDSRGFDFSGYKRTSLERRIAKRVEATGVSSYREYLDYLEVHPDEFTRLFDTILINVTSFFRDEPAWRFIADDIVPAIIAAVPAEQAIRVWSAGCASGQEAYTLAMLLADALGESAFLERVKIYATDVDEEALATARLGSYPLDDGKSIPPPMLEKYWQVNGSRITFRSDMRRSLIFGRNDLVQDAPISRVDLLVSRNTLMYFIPETQARILNNFNFSLSPHGFLFLGKSEMLLTYGALFRPYNLKWRVFTKVVRDGLRERLAFLSPVPEEISPAAARGQQLREVAADASPVAQAVLDRDGALVYANDAARRLFGIGAADLGRPVQDLEISYRPMELRPALQQAIESRRRVHVGRGDFVRAGATLSLEVDICPLPSAGELLGVSVTFADVTEPVELSRRFEESQRQLASAYEELQSAVEELETTNEELQSTNEELETTNEELQSTNEELETMNEELQSTNDELEAMNEQQRERGDEVDRLNLFLEGILGGLRLAVAVVDADQVVQVWNTSATELWGLRPDEVIGRHFLSLDIGLPLEQVRDAIRNTLADREDSPSRVLDAVNRRGKAFRCRVRVMPLANPSHGLYGAILLMSDARAEGGDGYDGAAAESQSMEEQA